ncbi:hypothetical protein [Streptomyces sp. 2A115]|uniref:hypothetical protein n=1 Tax=Streptomyces sp. 2A115 TaxID=3457439 RepID=UPI003FD1D5F3
MRAAGLVDVPAVVRLIVPPSSHAADGCPGHPEDWGQAQRAMRLMLAHYALEEGQVWVAERQDGVLLGAGIWLPPGTDTEPPDTRFSSLLSRELATGRQLSTGRQLATGRRFATGRETAIGRRDRAAVPAAMEAAAPDEPHWKVVIVGALDDTDTWDRTVVADLLAPGLRAVDDQAATAVAITISARQGERLRPFGFGRPREVPLTPGASAWLTTRRTRHPKGRLGGG